MRALCWLAVLAVTLAWSATTASAAGPVIRDHRTTTGVVVRDHRTSTGPVIRDHRSPYVVTVPTNSFPDKHKTPDTSHAPGGVVVTETPIVRDHRTPTGPIIRDHRTPTGPIIRDHRTPDTSHASGGVVVTPSDSTRRPASRPSQPKIVLPKLPKLPIIIRL